MGTFTGKVAVITGGTSGIGLGVARRCVDEGMHVALIGLNEDKLSAAADSLRNGACEIVGVHADVSRRNDMESAADRITTHFGRVDLLFNNAGVGAGTSIWESTWNDWEWVLSVNLMGVIHGVKIFTPLMLAQPHESYIVNNASIAGLVPFYPNAPYHLSKHGVVALTEHLHHSLKQLGARIHASVVCSGWVSDTQMFHSHRNRPPQLRNEHESEAVLKARTERLEKLLQDANTLTPAQIAAAVFDGMQHKKLYILPHPEYKRDIRQRLEAIVGS
jgi:NAD(P)-dependent dehydrogenase (short-subunit alcohol dehydrogenase family)